MLLFPRHTFAVFRQYQAAFVLLGDDFSTLIPPLRVDRWTVDGRRWTVDDGLDSTLLRNIVLLVSRTVVRRINT
jgi:hypothetical protein